MIAPVKASTPEQITVVLVGLVVVDVTAMTQALVALLHLVVIVAILKTRPGVVVPMTVGVPKVAVVQKDNAIAKVLPEYATH